MVMHKVSDNHGTAGTGLAMAVGLALSERLTNARFGDDLVDHHTYVIAGDGCLMEVSHVATPFAGHVGLDKLIVLFDDNAISIDGGRASLYLMIKWHAFWPVVGTSRL